MASEHDPAKRLWRDQPREEETMSIADIKARAEDFDRSNRRARGWTAALFVLLLAKGAVEVWVGPDVLERTGDVLLLAALLYVAYHFRDYYDVAPKHATLGLAASVEFYRAQLARQHTLASRPWQYLVAFVPGIALSVFGRAVDRPLWQNLAAAAFGVALFVGVAWVNARTARKLKAEIERLG
jgi:hypothetical protein